MKIVSVNVGMPRQVEWKGRQVVTGIFKEPVEGRVRVRTLNLEGDGQADLNVHGGDTKAVYVYPSEHYRFWREELEGRELPWGMFGENLTTAGLEEETVRIGDRFRIGTAEFQVTEPRMPCSKLGLRFGREDILKRFLASGRSGFYFSVLREGDVGAGDAIEEIHREENSVRVLDVTLGYSKERNNRELLQRLAETEKLPESWRGFFRKRLAARKTTGGD